MMAENCFLASANGIILLMAILLFKIQSGHNYSLFKGKRQTGMQLPISLFNRGRWCKVLPGYKDILQDNGRCLAADLTRYEETSP
jgi:hypothetical protein